MEYNKVINFFEEQGDQNLIQAGYREAWERVPSGVLSQFSLLAVALWLNLNQNSLNGTIGAGAVLVALCLFGQLLISSRKEDFSQAERVFTFLNLATGIFWGYTIRQMLLVAPAHPSLFLVAILVFGGVAIESTRILSSLPKAFLHFNGLLFLFFMGTLALSNSTLKVGWQAELLVLAYAIFVIRMGKSSYLHWNHDHISKQKMQAALLVFTGGAAVVNASQLSLISPKLAEVVGLDIEKATKVPILESGMSDMVTQALSEFSEGSAKIKTVEVTVLTKEGEDRYHSMTMVKLSDDPTEILFSLQDIHEQKKLQIDQDEAGNDGAKAS